MTAATPFSAIVEMVADADAAHGGTNTGVLQPGQVISRPMSFDDVAGDLGKFADDNSYEYIAEDNMWITDIKVQPIMNATTGAPGTPAAIVNSIQLYLKSGPDRWEQFISGLLAPLQVRPKARYVAKGTKIQFKQNVR